MTAHLAAPLRLGGDRALATLTQDSPAEVGQSVALLAATRPGERLAVPGYGTPDPVFGGVDLDAVTAALPLWEPRADRATVDVTTDPVTGDQTVAVDLTGPEA